jgi:hypothetical protein
MVEAMETQYVRLSSLTSQRTKSQGVSLESLTYKKQCCSAGKQLLESFHGFLKNGEKRCSRWERNLIPTGYWLR